MGNCASAGATEVSDEDKRRHREAEKSLKEVRVKTTTLSTAYIRICGVSSLSVHSQLIKICCQAKQKMSSQVKVGTVSFTRFARSKPVLQGIAIRVRRFRKIHHPQGTYLRPRIHPLAVHK
jgi:hypothetical protein